MKKLLLGVLLVLMPIQAWAIDTNVVGVVQDGKIATFGTYFAFGGEGTPKIPAFENQYLFDYYARGSAGFAQTNSMSGDISVKEQFELMAGHGNFVTKAGTGTLVNIPRQDSYIVDGRLQRNALGFGGEFSGPGVVLSTIDTSNGGLVGKSEAEMIGTFRAGAIQTILVGSNEQPIKEPIVVEYQEAHWEFGGKLQVRVEIIFP